MPVERNEAFASRLIQARSWAFQHLSRLARTLAVGFGAGIVAGFIAGGGGSRVAMRLVALADSANHGLVTENGNVVGEITFGATIGLLVSGAFVGGFFGGVAYVTVRRWIPGRGLWKGLGYGLLLFFITTPALLVRSENPDFHTLAPAVPSVVLFSLLPVFYGLVLAPIVERLDRYVPPFFYSSAATAIGYLALAGLSLIGLVFFAQDVGEIL